MTVGENKQQSIGSARLGFEDLARAADRSAQAGVARGLQFVEPGPTERAEALSECLDRGQVYSASALGPEGIDRDPVTGVFE